MRRPLFASSVVLSVLAIAPVLRADVKTTEKTVLQMEGLMGAMMNRVSGGAEGITSTVALKGNRLSRMNNATGLGQIVDLAEEKVYTIDAKKKEYSVSSFAEMRKQLEEGRAAMAARQQQMAARGRQAGPPPQAAQYEYDVKVTETGQKKQLAGQNVREVVLQIVSRHQGMTLEQGGGTVLTNTLWLAPKVAALDELAEFNARYYKALYGGLFAGMDAQQMSSISAMMPGFTAVMERMATEGRKLQGTPISTTSMMETVRSAQEMAQSEQPAAGDGGRSGSGGSNSGSSNSGLAGMMGRMMGRGPLQQRSTTLTTTHETLSIATTVSAEDVAVPAGFKEKVQ